MKNEKKFPVIEELKRLFGHFDRRLFHDKLKLPTHVIQSDKKVTFRFYSEFYHIVVGRNFGKLKSHEELVGDYLHEMVHIYNYVRHKNDCDSNQYHNKNFLEAALKIGFFIPRHTTQGWGITKFKKPKRVKSLREPTKKANDALLAVVAEFDFDNSIFKKAKANINSSNNHRKSYFMKYTCGCHPPHNSIRSGRRPDGSNPLNIRCLDCNVGFVCEEI